MAMQTNAAVSIKHESAVSFELHHKLELVIDKKLKVHLDQSL